MNLTLIILLSVLGFYLIVGIRVVRPTQRAAIETLGKYSKFANPGIHFIFLFIQRMIKMNVTERMANVDPQEIITKDNLNAKVDLVVFYKIKGDEENLKNALYNVNDVEDQIIVLAQTTARNVIGDMPFRDVNSKRNDLNKKLAKTMDGETESWGVNIVRVELKEINPPSDVQETMNKVIKAENEKDAARDFATAAETEADGKRRAAIKIAEGEKQSRILEAQGKAKAFELVNKTFTGNSQILKQWEVLQASLEDNTKIIITEKGISPTLIVGDLPMKMAESSPAMEKEDE